MKIGKYILWAVLFLLAAVAAGVGLYLYPAWKSAGAMEDRMSLSYKAFELEVELDREAIPAEQAQMFGILAGLTGIEEEALYRLSIKGGMEEDRIHFTVCPYGRTEPLFELYLSDDMKLINETMVYDAVRSHLAGRFGLLGYLMPVQEETVYLTLEQVEKLFGADLSAYTELRLQQARRSITAKEYFLLFAMMSREKQGEGYRFTLDTEEARLCFEVIYGGKADWARMELQAQNPADLLDKAGSAFPWLDQWLPGVEVRGLKSISLTLTPEERGTVTMPTNLASQEIVDTIAKLRGWIQETFGK